MPHLVDPPLVIAHAGGAALGPENTLAAIRASLATGVDAIEVDVWRSSDGTPVLLHDQTVDRTTNGEGNVSEMTLEQLQALDAGSGERIPTLAEAIEEVRGGTRLNVEVKDPAAASDVVETVRSLDAARDIWISSFSVDVLEACRWIAPEIQRSLLFARIPTDPSQFILYHTSNLVMTSLSPNIEFVQKNPRFVDLCHRRGIHCYVWTVDGAESIARALALEVDAIFTNDPRLARDILDQRLAATA